MKHAGLKIALTVSAAVTFGLALAGCSGGSSVAPYDHIVTFDYNFGTLNTTAVNQYLGVMDNSLIVMAPGDDNSNFKMQGLEGYEFKGWCLPKYYDENGELIRDEDGRVLPGDEWDFKTGRVTKDITLYANFVMKSQFTLIGRAESEGELIDVEIDDYSKLVFEQFFQGSPGDVFERPDDILAPSASGYTFVEYYKDAALTEVFEWPYELEEGGATVYARFLEGTWDVVSSPLEFVDSVAANANIYLTSNLDFTGVRWAGNYNYAGTINGNGHEITGISCDLTATRNTFRYGLFGTLGSTFKVYDLEMKDVSLTFTARVAPQAGNTYAVSMFADTVANSALFENFRFTGTLTVVKSSETISTQAYAISRDSADLTEYFYVNVIGGDE